MNILRGARIAELSWLSTGAACGYTGQTAEGAFIRAGAATAVVAAALVGAVWYAWLAGAGGLIAGGSNGALIRTGAATAVVAAAPGGAVGDAFFI